MNDGNSNGNNGATKKGIDPTVSEILKDVFYVAAAASATIGALELILASASSTSDSFRAAVRHNDHNATASLAQMMASINKMLGEETRTRKKVVIRESRADGAPVVT